MHKVLHLAQQVADVLNATDAEWSMKLDALGIAGKLLTHGEGISGPCAGQGQDGLVSERQQSPVRDL